MKCWKWPPSACRHALMRRSMLAKVRTSWSVVTRPISRRMVSSSAARVRGLFPYTVPFNMPHRKKSGGERSGDLGGHRPFETTRSGKKDSIRAMLVLEVEFFLHERDRWCCETPG